MVLGFIEDGIAGIGSAVGGLLGGGLGGLFGGGGSAGKIEIAADVKTEMNSDMTIGGGEKPLHTMSDTTIGGGEKPLHTKTENATKLEGGTPLHTKMELLLPQPLKTHTRTEMAVTEPVVTEMSTHMNMEPVVMDLCVNVGVNKLPQTRIRRPFQRRFAVSVGGEELLGFDWSGDSTLYVDDGRARPHVEGPSPAGSGHIDSGHGHPPHHVVSDDATPGFRIVVD